MAIAAFTGLFGSGKSALASWLAVSAASENRCPLWANYRLHSARLIYTVGELYDCRDGIIVLDELQATVHSRSFNANVKGGFLDWYDQCRKQGGELFLISQELAKMDVIVREMVQFLFVCEDVGNYYSEIKRYMRKPEVGFVPNGSFMFDRREAFGLYDHRARAWRLEPGSLPSTAAVVAASSSAPVEVSSRPVGSVSSHFQTSSASPSPLRPVPVRRT